jgi:hypothetical protein
MGKRCGGRRLWRLSPTWWGPNVGGARNVAAAPDASGADTPKSPLEKRSYQGGGERSSHNVVGVKTT